MKIIYVKYQITFEIDTLHSWTCIAFRKTWKPKCNLWLSKDWPALSISLQTNCIITCIRARVFGVFLRPVPGKIVVNVKDCAAKKLKSFNDYLFNIFFNNNLVINV